MISFQIMHLPLIINMNSKEGRDPVCHDNQRVPIPKIYNVVATLQLEIGRNLRLREIASKISNSQYNPKRFGALIMRVVKPKSTALIFKNGKIIITGCRSETEMNLSARKIVKKLKAIVGDDKVGWKSAPQTCNVVGSINMGMHFNLEKVVEENSQAQYDPNVFPALIYRMKIPRVTFLIFTTGKIVITGARTQTILRQSFIKLHQLLLKHQKYRN